MYFTEESLEESAEIEESSESEKEVDVSTPAPPPPPPTLVSLNNLVSLCLQISALAIMNPDLDKKRKEEIDRNRPPSEEENQKKLYARLYPS